MAGGRLWRRPFGTSIVPLGRLAGLPEVKPSPTFRVMGRLTLLPLFLLLVLRATPVAAQLPYPALAPSPDIYSGELPDFSNALSCDILLAIASPVLQERLGGALCPRPAATSKLHLTLADEAISKLEEGKPAEALDRIMNAFANWPGPSFPWDFYALRAVIYAKLGEKYNAQHDYMAAQRIGSDKTELDKFLRWLGNPNLVVSGFPVPWEYRLDPSDSATKLFSLGLEEFPTPVRVNSSLASAQNFLNLSLVTLHEEGLWEDSQKNRVLPYYMVANTLANNLRSITSLDISALSPNISYLNRRLLYLEQQVANGWNSEHASLAVCGAYYRLGNFAKAVEACASHQVRFPNDAISYYWKALALYHLNEFKAANEAIDQAITKANYFSSTFHVLRSVTRQELGDKSGSKADLNTACKEKVLDCSDYIGISLPEMIAIIRAPQSKQAQDAIVRAEQQRIWWVVNSIPVFVGIGLVLLLLLTAVHQVYVVRRNRAAQAAEQARMEVFWGNLQRSREEAEKRREQEERRQAEQRQLEEQARLRQEEQQRLERAARERRMASRREQEERERVLREWRPGSSNALLPLRQQPEPAKPTLVATISSAQNGQHKVLEGEPRQRAPEPEQTKENLDRQTTDNKDAGKVQIPDFSARFWQRGRWVAGLSVLGAILGMLILKGGQNFDQEITGAGIVALAIIIGLLLLLTYGIGLLIAWRREARAAPRTSSATLEQAYSFAGAASTVPLATLGRSANPEIPYVYVRYRLGDKIRIAASIIAAACGIFGIYAWYTDLWTHVAIAALRTPGTFWDVLGALFSSL